MIIAKVTGSVVSTRKMDSLIGNKFMVVEPMTGMRNGGEKIVAVDNIGAGVGEYVLVTTGSSARVGAQGPDSPVDAAIVGIIDDIGNLK